MTEDNPNEVQRQVIAACPGPWESLMDGMTEANVSPGRIEFCSPTGELTPITVTLDEVIEFMKNHPDTSGNVEVEFADFFGRVMRMLGEGDSVATGEFDPSSPLRDEVDRADCMGAGTDPGEMGNAEKYFRDLQQDEAQEGCPDDCPCMTLEEMPF
jgi:hypothetical protein